MDLFIKLSVVLLSSFVFIRILTLYFKSKSEFKEIPAKLPLLATGFIANIADTLGMGSFAVIVAINSRWKLISEKNLPGTLNAQSVLPAMLQSLFFLKLVEVDIFLLLSFVAAACLGGAISSSLVSRLDKQTIRLLMCVGFLAVSLILLANQLQLLPLGGEEYTLPPAKLAVGVVAMVFVGMLSAIGIGSYIPTQVTLFLLGLSPLAAFPIMTTTAAIVQSTTAYAFVSKKEVALTESLLLALAGVAGVAVAAPVITYVNLATLKWLLLFIVSYNGISIWRTYVREKVVLAGSENAL